MWFHAILVVLMIVMIAYYALWGFIGFKVVQYGDKAMEMMPGPDQSISNFSPNMPGLSVMDQKKSGFVGCC